MSPALSFCFAGGAHTIGEMEQSSCGAGYRYRRYRRPAGRRVKKYIVVAAILAALVGLFFWLQRSVTDLLFSLSEATVRALALTALNEAVAETLQWNGIEYDSLVTVTRDGEGEIVRIETDAQQLNLLARQTVALATGKLAAACGQGVQVPAGALTGIEWLAGFGPEVTFEILPVGAVGCDFRSEFAGAGINQTRHAVTIQVTAAVRILFPSRAMEVEASAQVPVCESVIVGEVPSIYFGGS